MVKLGISKLHSHVWDDGRDRNASSLFTIHNEKEKLYSIYYLLHDIMIK